MRERLSTNDLNYFQRDFLVNYNLYRDLDTSIKNYSKGRVLDIGCGNKPYGKILMQYCTEHIGCDIEQSHLSLVDIICPATDIPLEDQSFDTVFSTQVLEHVADHKKVFEEAYRMLKPGGYFIASVPMYWPHHEEPFDFFRFTKYGIRYLLDKTGFETIEIKSNGGKWALVGQSLNLALSDNKNAKGFWSYTKKIFRQITFSKYFINVFFKWADSISKDETNTMNFVFVGRKL